MSALEITVKLRECKWGRLNERNKGVKTNLFCFPLTDAKM